MQAQVASVQARSAVHVRMMCLRVAALLLFLAAPALSGNVLAPPPRRMPAIKLTYFNIEGVAEKASYFPA